MIQTDRFLPAIVIAACGLFGFLTGCTTPAAPKIEPLVARFFLEAHPSEEGRAVTLPQSEVFITIQPKPVVMEFDVVDAEVAEVSLGKCLLFKLTMSAARDLYRLSGASQGRRLVLTLNDKVMGARKIDRPLDDGQILVFVEVPDSTLPDLVSRLKDTSAEVRRKLAREQ